MNLNLSAILTWTLPLGGTFVLWWYQQRILAGRKKAETERDELRTRVTTLEKSHTEFEQKLALIDQTVLPIYEATKQQVIKLLTHPHPEFKVADRLLAKLGDPHVTLTPEESTHLERLIKERITDPNPEISEEERFAAQMFPSLLKLVNIEAECAAPVTETQIVSSTVPKTPDTDKIDAEQT
jgi:hypothetical protein